MTPRRATVPAVTAVVATALLVVLLVTWASSIGPGGVLRGDGIEPVRSSADAPSPAESVTATPRAGERGEDRTPDGVSSLVRALAFLVEVATAVLLLYLLLRFAAWLRRVYDARRRRDPRPEEVEFDVLAAPPRLAEEIRHDADEQRRLLTEGVPGNAIVACWHRFEGQATAAGLSRHQWETSSEFTLRILELVAADGGAVARLAGLYREARFSAHEMGEADRRAALEALDVIHHGLSQPAAGGGR